MKYVTKSTNVEFRAIMDRRSNKKFVSISYIKKNGEPSKPRDYQLYGGEKTVEDVIARLTRNNPDTVFVAA